MTDWRMTEPQKAEEVKRTCECDVSIPHWPEGKPMCQTCGLSLDSGAAPAEPVNAEAEAFIATLPQHKFDYLRKDSVAHQFAEAFAAQQNAVLRKELERAKKDLADSRLNHIDANQRNIQAIARAEAAEAKLAKRKLPSAEGLARKMYALAPDKDFNNKPLEWDAADSARDAITLFAKLALAALQEGE